MDKVRCHNCDRDGLVLIEDDYSAEWITCGVCNGTRMVVAQNDEQPEAALPSKQKEPQTL